MGVYDPVGTGGSGLPFDAPSALLDPASHAHAEHAVTVAADHLPTVAALAGPPPVDRASTPTSRSGAYVAAAAAQHADSPVSLDDAGPPLGSALDLPDLPARDWTSPA